MVMTVSEAERKEREAWKALVREERRYDDLRMAGAWWDLEQANGYVEAKREQWERAAGALATSKGEVRR